MSAQFDATKMYTYVKGYAMGQKWHDTLTALALARTAHKDQRRKSGEPYFVHPLTVACHALALGIEEDVVIAAALLHDVVEDCNISVESLHISDDTKDAVRRLTHVKGKPLEPYYCQIGDSRVASLVKLLDRCDNVSTMAGVFSVEKIHQYIEETREYVLPLLRKTKDQWPEDSNVLFVLKYHILSVIDGLEKCLNVSQDKAATA